MQHRVARPKHPLYNVLVSIILLSVACADASAETERPISWAYSFRSHCNFTRSNEAATFWSSYALQLGLGVIGVMGNPLSAVIWLSPAMRRGNSSAIYMAALCTVNLFVVAMHWLGLLNCFHHVSYIWTCLHVVLLNCSQYASNALVFGFTLDRCISVRMPFQRQRLCSPKRAIFSICVLICIPVAVFCPAHFLLWHDLGDRYRHMSLAFEVIFALVLPVAALFMNLAVISEMRRMQKAVKELPLAAGRRAPRETAAYMRTTVMLVTLSCYVIACSLTAAVLYVAQFHLPEPEWTATREEFYALDKGQAHIVFARVSLVAAIFLQTQYTIGFFIYFITHRGFRREAVLRLRLARCCPGFWVERCAHDSTDHSRLLSNNCKQLFTHSNENRITTHRSLNTHPVAE